MTQINEQLHITAIQEARDMNKDDLDRVVTVCQDGIADHVPTACNYDVFRLADGRPREGKHGSSSYKLFAAAARSIEEALRNDEEILVHCHAGISRSGSASIAALASIHDKSYEEAFEAVRERREKVNPHPYLEGLARRYINGGEPVDYEPDEDAWRNRMRGGIFH